jgi:hypothetical protein
MTAIRNFPNAPLPRRTLAPLHWRMPAIAIKAWLAMHRYGQRRAALELDALANQRALGNPVLARQLRSAAAECRRAANTQQAQASIERSLS